MVRNEVSEDDRPTACITLDSVGDRASIAFDSVGEQTASIAIESVGEHTAYIAIDSVGEHTASITRDSCQICFPTQL